MRTSVWSYKRPNHLACGWPDLIALVEHQRLLAPPGGAEQFEQALLLLIEDDGKDAAWVSVVMRTDGLVFREWQISGKALSVEAGIVYLKGC